ncbi:MAG: hypothetical protein HY300_01840 [Verrucomicrobia bacterium]|nr:hypothetical protein [Verrucomicrobiota bacterium]
MATHYSGRIRRLRAVLAVALAAVAAAIQAQTQTPAGPAQFIALAEKNYHQARARFLADTNSTEAAWQFGRACFDRAEFAASDTQRATLAVEGIGACRPLLTREPKLAAGHYYLAMNLGQLARTRMLGARPLVDDMERQFKLARELDAAFDHAGPDRCLGLLYRDAPGWPASVGSKSKARTHLNKSVEVAPDFPENRLNLLESALKWSDKKTSQRELDALQELLPRARTNFTGEAWASSWADWDSRWAAAQAKAKQPPPSIKPPKSPK